MKTRVYLGIITFLFALCICTAATCGSGGEAELVPGEEWSWERGAYNTFTGKISLSGCAGDAATVRVSAELPYEEETEQKSLPVFTSVNGKRIVMTRQSDTVQVKMADGTETMEFAVSFRLPEKKNISSVPLTFQVFDTDGNILKTISGMIGSDKEGFGQSGSPYYIPVDIRQITVIIAVAAALVWTFVLISSIRIKKKQKTGV